MVLMRNSGYYRLSTRSRCTKKILSIIDIIIIIIILLLLIIYLPTWRGNPFGEKYTDVWNKGKETLTTGLSGCHLYFCKDVLFFNAMLEGVNQGI